MQKLSRLLLKAGFIPVVWFLFWSALGAAFAPGYDSIRQQVSELGLVGGLPELCEQISGLGVGLAFVAFAIGLWATSDRKIAVGALAWIVFGVAMISNGVWRMGSPMHGLYAIGVINLIAPAMSCLDSTTLRNDRTAYAVTAFVSVAGIVYLWLNLLGLDPQDFKGLTQRVFSSINSIWPFAIAMLSLRRQTALPQPRESRRSVA